MVKAFQFSRLPKIIFRNGAIGELTSQILQYGSKIFLVTGKKSFLGSANSEKLLDDFKQHGIIYHFLSVQGEPSPEVVDTAVKQFSSEKIDLIVGIGGGSVLDTGKALSAMMYRPESVSEFLEGVGTNDHPGTKLPFIAIPTTSGTGSEVTKNAVISNVGKSGFKKSLRHDNFDPELTLNCPQNITAASGMDCFTQLTEAFLSEKSNEFTDAFAIAGLKQIKTSLIRCYIDGGDIEARSGMSFAALSSGICLANAGLGVVHGFASSIGGMYNIPHGLICGTLMASGNQINLRELRKKVDNQPALKKYAILGELFIEKKGKSDNYYADCFLQFLHCLTADLNLPGLSEYGVEEKDLDLICRNTEIKNNPVKLSPDDLRDILRPRVL
jgi:alcohol dehydrogenase class IV